MSGDSAWAKIPHDRDEWKRTVRDRWKDWLESLPERTKVLGNGSAFWTADDSLGVRMWRSGYNDVSTITLMRLHTEFEVVGENGEPCRNPHVVPLGDAIEHNADERCVCGPTPTFVEGGVVHVHHSLDERERNENEVKR